MHIKQDKIMWEVLGFFLLMFLDFSFLHLGKHMHEVQKV